MTQSKMYSENIYTSALTFYADIGHGSQKAQMFKPR